MIERFRLFFIATSYHPGGYLQCPPINTLCPGVVSFMNAPPPALLRPALKPSQATGSTLVGGRLTCSCGGTKSTAGYKVTVQIWNENVHKNLPRFLFYVEFRQS